MRTLAAAIVHPRERRTVVCTCGDCRWYTNSPRYQIDAVALARNTFMLVVVEPAAVEAVRERVRTAGLEATVYPDDGQTTVLVKGDNAEELADELSAISGVGRVICSPAAEAPVARRLR